jgi:hypothetical protein
MTAYEHIPAPRQPKGDNIMPGTKFDQWSESHNHPPVPPLLPGHVQNLPKLPSSGRPYIMGVDHHKINIPQGQRFLNTKLTRTSQHGYARVKIDPDAGATGQQEIVTVWTCLAGGTVDYTVEVFSESLGVPPPSEVIIDVTDPDAIQHLATAMSHRKQIKFSMGGPDAQKLLDSGILDMFTGQRVRPMAVGIDDLTLIIIVLGGLSLGAIALTCTTIIAYKAIENHYDVDIDVEMKNVQGVPVPTLTWNLKPI